MRLAGGLKIGNPRGLLRAFVEHWYPMYDGVPVAHDSRLTVPDIALSTMLNSRTSGNTAGAIWRAREQVEQGLTKIPANIDVLGVPADAPIPGADGISQAITAMCGIRRVKLSVATKILHKKRPALIPIFDSVVESCYMPICDTARGRSYGDYAVALTRLVHKDMLGLAGELKGLENEMAANGTPMTALRILNVLTWAVAAGNERWLLNREWED